jgi:hypothetical protein
VGQLLKSFVAFPLQPLLSLCLPRVSVCSRSGQLLNRRLKRHKFVEGPVALPLQVLLRLGFLGDLRLQNPIATLRSLAPCALTDQLGF